MKLKISRSELLAALYLTQGIVERRTTVPILGNVLIRAVEGEVTVSATDQEVSVLRRCEGVVEEPGALTTGARKLYEMIREFPEGDVQIQALENNWVQASAGRSRFRLVGLDRLHWSTGGKTLRGSVGVDDVTAAHPVSALVAKHQA